MTINAGASAAIYTRISSDPSGKAAGVERQRKACMQLADDSDFTVVGTYEDNDVSAYSGRVRPNFERLLTDAAEGRFDVVIVWAADRLYRRLSDLERIVGTFEAAGVHVAAVKSGEIDLSTADGRLHARLLGSVAQHESEKKSERLTARAEQRATVERRYSCSRLPFGFRWAEPDPDNASRPRGGSRAGLELDPVQAPALAAAYRDMADGLTLQATLRRLSQRVELGKMSPTALRLILRNPRNAGLAAYKGRITGEAADGLHIVDRALWEKVGAILSDPTRKTHPGRPSSTPYGGGLLRCGKCGGPLASGRKTGGPTYVCGKNRCMGKRRDRIDRALTETIAEVLSGLHSAGWLTVAALSDDESNLGLRTQAAELEERLDTLATMVAIGDLDPLDFGRASARIRAELEGITAKMRKTTNRPALAAIVDDPVTRFTSADVFTQRAIAGELLEAVTVPTGTDPRLLLHWKGWMPTGLPEAITVDKSKPPSPTNDQRRAAVADLYTNGTTSVMELARVVNCSRHAIRRDLTALGLYEAVGT